MSESLRPLDAVWLMMETDDTPMHVGVMATFCLPKSAPPDFLQAWFERMRRSDAIASPWNCRVQSAAPGLLPSLVPENDFDLDYHFRHSALPRPGGERELGVVISRLHSQPLDHDRPLWEMHLVEGLENNRFALYLKLHHALVDNVNAIPLVTSWLSRQARKRKLPPLWSMPVNVAATPPQVGEALRSVSAAGQASAGFFRDLLKRGAQSSFLSPLGTPRSTLNRRINSQRRFATQQIAQARVERLAELTDSTLNEILAYLCSSSLRRFFKEYNALPDKSLVAATPVSLAERSAKLPGNAIAGLRVELGTHHGNPLERLKAIKRSMQAVRADRETLPDAAATSYFLLRAAPIYASQAPVLGRLVPPLSNLTISNTPVQGGKRYLDGAPLEAIYPVNPLMQYAALSIDCVGYAGMFNIGITGARDTLPHLQRLAVYLGRAADDLEQVLGVVAKEGAA